MFSIFKKIFRSPKNKVPTVEELEQHKREMQVQLELLEKIEYELKNKHLKP